MSPFNQPHIVLCLNVSGACCSSPNPAPLQSARPMTYIYHCLILPAAVTHSLFFIFFIALDTAFLSLTVTGCYIFCLCLSYLLTQHHRFGIDLCWPRMLLHSSGDEQRGAGRGCLPFYVFLGHILMKTPGNPNLSILKYRFTLKFKKQWKGM